MVSNPTYCQLTRTRNDSQPELENTSLELEQQVSTLELLGVHTHIPGLELSLSCRICESMQGGGILRLTTLESLESTLEWLEYNLEFLLEGAHLLEAARRIFCLRLNFVLEAATTTEENVASLLESSEESVVFKADSDASTVAVVVAADSDTGLEESEIEPSDECLDLCFFGFSDKERILIVIIKKNSAKKYYIKCSNYWQS